MIERIWGSLSLNTHETNYFKAAVMHCTRHFYSQSNAMIHPAAAMRIADPFARNCRIAEPFDNDIDPGTDATHHMDAKDFLKTLAKNEFDLIIFDPPFSSNQAGRYGDANIYTKGRGYVPECMKLILMALKPNGLMIKFGFNSTRHMKQFELEKLYVVNHGGNHNDTLVSIWRKAEHTLEEWIG
jgi:hypothetical protein